MDWRSVLLRFCGPGSLSGITLRQWRALRRDPGLEIDARYFPRALFITQQAIKNSALTRWERRFDTGLSAVKIEPPVFILGHWRSGTTLLHDLLAQDRRFAFPNSYQTSFPHIFLSAERTDARLLSAFVPKRRPMDNMPLSLSSPQEDEFALSALTLRSPYMSWVFPRARLRFERYLTWRETDPAELREWGAAFRHFLKKLQYRHGPGHPLLLKSPPHTARIPVLLRMFPEARFVHICRDPYRVFLSSRRTFEITRQWHGLQRGESVDLDEDVIRQYRAMYEAFQEDKRLIPKGRFCEVRFENLERDPVREVEQVYRSLGFPAFREAEPALRRYVGSLNGYRKNVLPEMDVKLRARVATEWKPFFEEWGYPN